ncbi:MAG: 50S ribosomal protein L18 [Thermodesulfobacteriota bacterium]
MGKTNKKHAGWLRRKARVRKKVRGTAEVMRLNVFRSNKHIYAQLVNDLNGTIVLSASTLNKDIKAKTIKAKKVDAAKEVGEYIGKLAVEKGVERIVFDRNGYLYHGRVKALADGAREAGLKF